MYRELQKVLFRNTKSSLISLKFHLSLFAWVCLSVSLISREVYVIRLLREKLNNAVDWSPFPSLTSVTTSHVIQVAAGCMIWSIARFRNRYSRLNGFARIKSGAKKCFSGFYLKFETVDSLFYKIKDSCLQRLFYDLV